MTLRWQLHVTECNTLFSRHQLTLHQVTASIGIGIGQTLVSWYRYRQHWRYRSNPNIIHFWPLGLTLGPKFTKIGDDLLPTQVYHPTKFHRLASTHTWDICYKKFADKQTVNDPHHAYQHVGYQDHTIKLHHGHYILVRRVLMAVASTTAESFLWVSLQSGIHLLWQL